MYDIIEKKRDAKELTKEEIKFFVYGYSNGNIPDYQASALLMAIYFNGMNKDEMTTLTEAMAKSGDMVDLSQINGIKVDKHSTGGVGDKTTLIIGPIVAACGIPVAKMSGKGLGHTGGTIDKLESIPGFKTSFGSDEFIQNVKSIGISIAGQSGNLVPADKKLYSLRDVTATVSSMPLIASSIMSKKIASGADKIVLDVKTGSGAFMKSIEESIELAQNMVEIGEKVGRKTVAYITDMDIPLGNSIGNSLEVIEAFETLKGNGPKDLAEVSFEIAARMLELAGYDNIVNCRNKVKDVVENGKALSKLSQMIKNQGGDEKVVYDYTIFKKANKKVSYCSNFTGYIKSIDTERLGIAAMILGAGREKKEDMIDYSAGITLCKKTGEKVTKGEVIATLYSDKEYDSINQAVSVLDESIRYCDMVLKLRPLIFAYVDINGVSYY